MCDRRVCWVCMARARALTAVATLAPPRPRSSVEWCSSLWLQMVTEVDPSFARTTFIVTKLDNRLKEFTARWEVDKYLSTSGYLAAKPFFVALPQEPHGAKTGQ